MASNSGPGEKSKNAIAVKLCRDRKKEVAKERVSKIEYFKKDNQERKTNITAMGAQLGTLNTIFEAHNKASGGLFGQDPKLKEYFK